MWRELFVVFGVGCCLSISSVAETYYYGEFDPNTVQLESLPGRPGEFKTLRRFTFTDPDGLQWIVPEGAEINGASIPRLLWTVYGAPMGAYNKGAEASYLNASVIHDFYCDTKGGEEKRTAHSTHKAFYYAMLTDGVDPSRAAQMYYAVRTFGPHWWVERTFSADGESARAEIVTSIPAVRERQISEADKLKAQANLAVVDQRLADTPSESASSGGIFSWLGGLFGSTAATDFDPDQVSAADELEITEADLNALEAMADEQREEIIKRENPEIKNIRD